MYIRTTITKQAVLSRLIRVSHLNSDLRTAPKSIIAPLASLSSRPYAAHELHNTQDCQRSVLAPASLVRNTSGLTFFTSRLSPAVHPFCARLLYVSPSPSPRAPNPSSLSLSHHAVSLYFPRMQAATERRYAG